MQNFSNEVNMTVEKLIQEFLKIGIVKTKYDTVSILEKKYLIKHLNENELLKDKNIFVLKRKIRSIVNVASFGKKSKNVSIEVRKNKKYFKTDNSIKELSLKKNNNNCVQEKIFRDKDNNVQENISNNLLNDIKNKINYNNVIVQKKTELDIRKRKISIVNQIDKKNHSKYLNMKKILKKNVNIKNSFLDAKKGIKSKPSHRIKSININNNFKDSNLNNSKNSNKNNSIENYRFFRNKAIKKNNKKNNSYYEKIRNTIHSKIETNSNKNYKQNQNNTLLKQVFTKPLHIVNRNIILNGSISIYDLANKMARKSSEIIKIMMKLGYIVTINQVIEQDIAQLVAEEMGHKVTIYSENYLEEQIMKDRDFGNGIKKFRPPVVTIMGHVDHGKTSLLDKIRSTKVASLEFGGITQSIGAYYVNVDDKIITFLDTPGHSAFTAMRARGAKITDIVVLVIAADDGIKPQTIEAIQHAQAASVPILVAINKIDKTTINLEKIKNELTKYNIIPEEWGGDNIFVNVSAKSGTGIKNLLHAILMQSEVLELKSTFSGMASGLVIESYLDKNRGPTATILVKKGNLCKGDVVLCGSEYGRIRAINDDLGNVINSAGPSVPVKIFGLSGILISGEEIFVVRDEKKARLVALYRLNKFREKKIFKQQISKSSDIFSNIKNKDFSELNIIIKSDFQGSLEAISDALLKLSTNEINIKIVGKGVGGITETDVLLAVASGAFIIGFNVCADSKAIKIIKSENVKLRYYSVIYHIVDEIKNFMCGMLSPKYKQEVIGLAKVRNIFKSPKLGVIVGCMVIDGVVKRNSSIRILRKNLVVYEGELISLRRFKEDISEVKCGMECGIGIKNYNDVIIEDLIEVFNVVKI